MPKLQQILKWDLPVGDGGGVIPRPHTVRYVCLDTAGNLAFVDINMDSLTAVFTPISTST